MFIYWGTRRKDTRMGYVADFCPICRCARQFSLNRIGMAGHLYGVSIGGGKTIGFLKVCQDCKVTVPAEPSQYEGAEKKKADSVSDLLRSTFPNFASVHAERLKIEESIPERATALPQDVRNALLREPFHVVAFHKANAARETSSRPALWILAAFVLPIIAGMLVSAIQGLSDTVMLVTFVGCIGAAIWTGICDALGWSKSAQTKLLSRALAPLRPSLEEVTAVLNSLEVRGSGIWNRHRPERIMRWIDAETVRAASASASTSRPAAAGR